MIDSHAHLDSEKYDKDRDLVLQRAREAGVRYVVNPGADLKNLDGPVRIAEQYENVFAGVGVHPYEIDSVTNNTFLTLQNLLKHPKVVAVGEVGLEKTDGMPPLTRQLDVLQRFVSLAQKNDKPLIFHVRNAHEEFKDFIKGLDLRGVMHCFSGNLEDLEFYCKNNLFLSIPGIVSFPNANSLREVVKKVPIERLIVETDAPFLAPQKYRGQRNEPAYVVETAKFVAEIQGTTLEEIENATEQNTIRLFNLPVKAAE